VDANCEIPPEKEALVFEEIASFDFDFNGKTLKSPRLQTVKTLETRM
jgi:hypothetical protein